jgi:hypothetical protein
MTWQRSGIAAAKGGSVKSRHLGSVFGRRQHIYHPDCLHKPPFTHEFIAQFRAAQLARNRRIRAATDALGALVKRGLLKSDTPQGKVRFGLPQHALRFLFPSLWPEAEADAASVK